MPSSLPTRTGRGGIDNRAVPFPGPLRFVAVAPSGDVYVKTREVGIIGLRDADGDGRAEIKEAFGSGGGTGIALRDGWLYHSTNSAVLRYKLTAGELTPEGRPETIVKELPDEKQHSAKSFTFDEAGNLFVEVGSPSNAYGDPDRARGAKGKDPTEFLKTHGSSRCSTAATSSTRSIPRTTPTTTTPSCRPR